MKTTCQNGRVVETWFDSSTRLWVTQTKDADGNQIGEAEYGGRYTKAVTHAQAVNANGGEVFGRKHAAPVERVPGAMRARKTPKRCVLHLEADTLEDLIADIRKALLNLEEARR